VLCVWKRYLDQLRSRSLEPGSTLLPDLVDFRRHAIEPVLLWNADAQTLHRFADCGFVIRDCSIGTGCIFRIGARHWAHQDRLVSHAARKWSRLAVRGT